jgi:beta propeller repeat protein
MRRLRSLSLTLGFVMLVVLILLTASAAFAVPVLSTTETRLTANSADQYDPAISGDHVVYLDLRGYDSDIWCYDLSTGQEFPVTTARGDQQLPDISGDRIVYADYTSFDVWLYDIVAGTTTNLTAGSDAPALDPAIGQDIVAWIDMRDGNQEIYAESLTTGEVRRLSNDPAPDTMVRVDSGFVVWQRCYADSGGAQYGDIYVYDWNTGVTTLITPESGIRLNPDVDAGRIVYETYYNYATRDTDLSCYDFVTGTETRLYRPGTQENPWVSFDEPVNGVNHVRLWHVPTNQVFDLGLPASSWQYLNGIDTTGPNSGRIVYTDNRNPRPAPYAGQQSNIYMTTFELKFPKAMVSPTEVLFGDVEVGKSTTAIVTLTNAAQAPLKLTDLTIDPAAAGVSLVAIPTLPAEVAPGASIDLQLSFAPAAASAVSGVLKFTSDDPASPVISVPLSGRGVVTEVPPGQMFRDLLAYYDACVADGTIVGTSPGSKAAKLEVKVERAMIEAASNLYNRYATTGKDWYLDAAIDQLGFVHQFCDGKTSWSKADFSPPDLVKGTNRGELDARVLKLMTTLSSIH